jgi:hypothetical protein
VIELIEAIKCAERALALAHDLDKVRGAGDLAQISAGVRHELDCVIQNVCNARDALGESAVGNRTGKVRTDADATSEAAARAIAVKSGSQRHKVLDALYRFGDQTDEELQIRLQLDQNSERPRRGELVDAGFVTPTNLQRLNRKGLQCRVWTLSSAGYSTAVALSGHPEIPRETQAQSLF